LTPATVVECRFYHLWESPHRYRDDGSAYRPHWKRLGVVDNREFDFDRSSALPLHQPRVSEDQGDRVVRFEELPVFHAQYLVERRNQAKQAWYRCREWMAGIRSVRSINDTYNITLPRHGVQTTAIPPEWLEGVTFPDFSIDRVPAWYEDELLRWFDERGVEFFEPLDMWHVPRLRAEFVRRTGRRPRPDRSHLPSVSQRIRGSVRGALGAAKRRVLG
jgi:hypothetical protein